jgi:putative ABC transport system permease protein
MPFLDAIRLALAQIRVQKLKSFFTLLGVTIGVMFLIAVVSIVEGMSRYMEEDFAGKMLGVNTFTLRRFPWFSGGNMTAQEWRLMQRNPRVMPPDLEVIKDALPAGTRWAVDNQQIVQATSRGVRPRQVEAHAVEGDYFTIKNYEIERGRVFAPQEMALGSLVLVIGHELAEYFYPGLDPIGRELKMGGLPYTVIGVIEEQGSLFGMSLDRMAIAPFRSPLHRMTNPRGDIDGFIVQAPSLLVMDEAMESVREAMRGHRKLRPSRPDNFVMETSASALAGFANVKAVMLTVGTALPAIGLVVGGMVIMNIMLVAVAERTREIGIRKSLGARRKDILRQFLVEAATLSTLGAMLGIALGIGIAETIAWRFPLPAAVAPWSIVAATLLGTVVGIVSGVYPARRAARLDPIAALRQE